MKHLLSVFFHFGFVHRNCKLENESVLFLFFFKLALFNWTTWVSILFQFLEVPQPICVGITIGIIIVAKLSADVKEKISACVDRAENAHMDL